LDYNILSEEQINGIHRKCHCYVSYTKGEGTGYTSCQAALEMKPIIIGNYSACREYLKDVEFVDVEEKPSIFCDLNYERHLKNCSENMCIYNKWFDPRYQKWGVPIREQFLRCFIVMKIK